MPSSRRALIVAALLFAPSLLAAQSLWISPLTSRGDIDLEWTRPTFKNLNATETFRGIWIATGRFRVGQRGAVIVAVPRLVGGGFSSIGNPYIGYQASEGDGKSILSLGVRIPNISTGYSTEQMVAFIGDYDRAEEMLPQTLTIHAEGQGKVWRDSSGADVRVRAGFSIFHPTDTGSGSDNTLLFDYGIRFGRGFDRIAFGAGITGRYWASGSGGTFTDRNVTEGAVDLAWHGRVTPRVALRIPLTEPFKNAYSTALILGLEVALP
jgi:hypothetical protein